MSTKEIITGVLKAIVVALALLLAGNDAGLCIAYISSSFWSMVMSMSNFAACATLVIFAFAYIDNVASKFK